MRLPNTTFICDALATSQDSRMLRVPAQKAVRFALAAQNPGNGWKYDLREGHNDTSVTGWMILALKGARNAGQKWSRALRLGRRGWLLRAHVCVTPFRWSG